jgi:hypothetical protein
MSNSAGEQPLATSVFTGTEQRLPECDLSAAQESFNVEFVNGAIRRRLGRQKVFTSATIRPSGVYFIFGGVPGDVTDAATDGILTVPISINLWNGANNGLAIGCPFRFNGINLVLQNALSVNTTINVRMMGRAPGGTPINLGTPASITDGTAVGGFTLKQSGTISWAFSDWATTNWGPGGLEQQAITQFNLAFNAAELYWIQIFPTNTTGNGGDVTEASVTLTDKNGLSVMTESSGMTEFVTKNGRRVIVSTNNLPGQFNDSITAAYSENRVFSYDFGRGDIVPLRLPLNMRSLSAPNRQTSYATFNGYLIGATPSGALWKYDGTSTSALESLPGMDVVNGVLGANGYTAAPTGTMLEVYRNRLAVTGNYAYPLQFQLSMEDNNVSQIPVNATVGGPNVWPLRYVFNVPGKQGDRIMGASVVNDRYCILTRNQLWVFDDTSLKLANSDIGCVATGSVCRVDNAVYFLSDIGVCMWDSVNISVISDPISETLNKMVNWRALDWVTSVHDRARSEYWLWLPINGETRNQIAAIYNYKSKSWRISGGWYPFDTNTNRDAGPAIWSATAACSIQGATGRNIILSSDHTSALWQESTGYEDDGVPFPAYAVFRPYGSKAIGGENYSTFRAWYLETDMDGAIIQGIQLGDGERFDQEIDRLNNSVTLNSQNAQKQALVQNAVSANGTTPTFAAPPSWSVSAVPLTFGQRKKLKLSFGRKLTWMQPALHWRPATGSFGRGAIYAMQLGEAPQQGGR